MKIFPGRVRAGYLLVLVFAVFASHQDAKSQLLDSAVIDITGSGGGSCLICSSTYQCNPGSGWTIDYLDPSVSGRLVTGVDVVLYYTGCSNSNVVVKINNTLIDTIDFTYSCQCNTCTTDTASRVTLTGIPGYQTGDTNTLQLETSSSICVAKVVVYIHYKSNTSNDAGVASLDSLDLFCTGNQNFYARVANYGNNKIDSVNLNWSFNDTLQSAISIIGTLDTIGGSGSYDTLINLGSKPLNNLLGDKIKIWTSSPNGTTDTSNFNDTLQKTLIPSLSGTYTIGGTSPDYATIAAAIADVTSRGVCGNVVFKLRTGTYSEQLTIGKIKGAGSNRTVTFESETGDSTDVLVTYFSTSSSENWVVRLLSANYVNFRKLSFKSTGTSYGRVFEFQQKPAWIGIANCVIEGLFSSSGSNYALVYSADGQGIGGLDMTNCRLNYGGYAFYLYGNSSARVANIQLENNHFTDQRNASLWLSYGLNVTIQNNLFESFTYYISGVYMSYSDDFRIQGNRFQLHKGGEAIELYSSDGSAGKRAVIANNFISVQGGSSHYGLLMEYNTYVDVVFNSIHLVGSTSNCYGVYLYGNNYLNLINNNIVSDAWVYYFYDYSNSVINFNNVYSKSSFFAYNGAVSYASLKAWQSATLLDSNSRNVDPDFPSFGDLRTKHIDLNQTGMQYSGISTDIDGNTRDTLNPDIGADEFEPNALDASLIDFQTITRDNPDLHVVLKNNGKDTLTSAKVNWRVGTSVKSPVTWNGTLASGDTAWVNLDSLPFTYDSAYIVTAWSSEPNSSVDSFPGNDTTTSVVAYALAGVYTIGGTSPDFVSFNAAVTALKNGGISDTVLFNVRDTTYNEQISIPAISGTEAGYPITFTSESGDSSAVVLSYSSTSGANYIVELDGANHIRFRKMTFRALSASYGKILVLRNGPDYNEWTNCHFYGYPTTSTTSNHILVTKDNNGKISGNTFRNNLFTAGSSGFQIDGNSSDRDVNTKIENNVFLNQYYRGVYVNYQDSFRFTGNEVQSNTNYYSGIYGIYGNNLETWFRIDKNRIYGNVGYGIYLYSSYLSSGDTGFITNNFITSSIAGYAYGMYLGNNNNIRICYNNVLVTSGSQSDAAIYYYYNSNLLVHNNNFVNYNAGYATYVYNNGNQWSGLDNNNYYTRGITLAYFGTDRDSLSDWQAYSGRDSSSLNTDPEYTSATDLHVANIVLNAKGRAIPGVDDDIDSETRDTVPDIGADEFFPSAHDASLKRFTDPGNSFRADTILVKSMLRNSGLDTLKSVTINWEVNSDSQTVVHWTGALASGDSAEVSLGSYVFNDTTAYTLAAWTSSPNSQADGNLSNDTVRILNRFTSLSGIYTIGGSSPDYINFSHAVSALKSRGIADTVIFNVRSGTYNEHILIPKIQGTYSNSQIVFRSETGDSSDVTLTYASTTLDSNYTVFLDGAERLVFRNLTLKTSSVSTYARVIVLNNGASYNRFENNEIVGVNTGSTTYYQSVVYCNNRGDSNSFTGNILRNGSYGFYVETSENLAQENLRIENNQFNNTFYLGLYLYYASHPIITANFIYFNSTASNSARGMYLYECTDSIIVARNDIRFDKQGYGIMAYYCGQSSLDTGHIMNNFISAGNVTSSFSAFYIYNSYGLQVVHNNARFTGNATGSNMIYSQYGSSNRLLNNVLVNEAGGKVYHLVSNGIYSDIDYNVVLTSGTVFGYYVSANYPSLTGWIAATGHDSNSMALDPFFAGTDDLHIRNIDLHDAALPLPFVMNDFDGETRGAAPDMGADEFDPPLLDAGVVAIVSPVAPFPADTLPITAAVKNHGSQDITAVKIFWEINTRRDSMVWNDTITSGDSTHVVLRNFYFDPDSIYHLKVWTSIPNGIPDTSNYNDTVSVQDVAPALTGIYTIGGAFPDFATFNDAVIAMVRGGIIDTVRFDVRNGTYKERIKIPQITGAANRNSIIFQSENKDSSLVTLKDSALNTSDNYVVYLNGADGVTFRHMTISARHNTYGRVVLIDNESHNASFLNNVISGVNTTSTSSNNYLVYGNSSLDTAALFRNNYFLNGSVGLYLIGVNSAIKESGTIIDHNEFRNQVYMGMQLYYQDDLEITDNLVRTASSYTGFYGIYLYYNSGIYVTGNDVSATLGYQALYLYESINSSSARGLIANNFFHRGGANNSQVVNIAYGSNIDFIYNNINDYSSNTGSSALYFYYGSGHVAKNNVLRSSNGYAIYRQSTGLGTSDYNDLYTGGTNLGYYNGVRADLSAWQSSTGLDANSISSDPLFVSQTDLHVSNTDLNAAGTPFPGLTIDFDNQLRDTVTPDIGADEFELPAADDAGIAAFIGPASPFVSGTRAVFVTIKNHGSDTLTSATVNWQLNGATQTAYSWSGNLASGETDTVTAGTFNFAAGVVYQLKSWTTSPNGVTDTVNWNDTLVKPNLLAGLDGIYTIGGVAPDFSTFADAISALTIGGVVDTVEFHVRAGTYDEQVSLGPYPGASSAKPVLFTSEDGDSSKVVLQFNANSSNNYVVRMLGVSYLTWADMTIRSNNTYYARCFEIGGEAHHIAIRNNRIHAANTNGGISDLVYSGSTKEHYLTIRNNRFISGRSAIYLSGAGSNYSDTEAGNIITDNILSGQRYNGIQLQYQKGAVISRNVISSAGINYGSYTGIQIYFAHDSVQVHANNIQDPSTGGSFIGVYFYEVDRSTSFYPSIVNNFISSNQSDAFGIRLYYCSDIEIYHNSVNLYHPTSTNTFALYLYYNTGLRSRNNILANNARGYAIYNYNNSLNLAISDYNDLYTKGTGLAYFNGTTYNTLNGWQTGVSKDVFSVSINPNYVSNTNLHAYISSLDGAAYPLASITTDIDGDLRDTLLPDIGADEFNSLPDNVGISRIYLPVDGCELDSVEVKIDVFNYGSLPQTGFNVVYRVDNGSPVTQNFGTSDTLEPGTAAVFTFNQKHKVYTGNTYEFRIFTDLSNDQDRNSDTVVKSITNFNTPDTVKNMIPADSAINRDFPLILSWSPVSGATHYDVYVWQAGGSRPSTPLRSSLVSISTTINQNELIVLYGKSYSWQVKAYNDYCSVWSPQNLFTMKELPDLMVTSVTAPSSAFSGTSISVGWVVTNDSSGVTGATSWYDMIVLSDDSIFDGTDLFLGYELNKTALGQGQSYANSKTVNLPNGLSGNLYILVIADRYNHLPEKNNNNNARGRLLPISLTPPPDLQVTSIIKPTQIFSGTTMNVQWTVTNNGSGGTVSSSWVDRVYLSTDSTIGSSSIYLGSKTRSGALPKDSSYQQSITGSIPVNYSGNYYVLVRTDHYNQVYEHASESNNTGASDTLKVILAPPPDFVVNSLTIQDTASNRTWVNVGYTVENFGAGSNYNTTWYDRVYISHKSTFNKDSSQIIYTAWRSGTIPAFGSQRYNVNVLIPSNINGPYFIYVETDLFNHIFEYNNEDNNVSAGSSIQIVSPDLIVRNVQLPVEDSSGKAIQLKYHIVNNGPGQLVNSAVGDSIFISSDSVYGSGAQFIGRTSGNLSLVSGDSAMRTVMVTIPDGLSGTNYIHVVTDRPNKVFEAGLDMNNGNFGAMNVVLTPWPDLAFDGSVATSDSVASGDTIQVSYTVINNGIGDAEVAHSHKIYLSKDTSLGSSDTEIGEYQRTTGLKIDSSYLVSMDILIPPVSTLGNYYVIVQLDAGNTLYEHQREDNNIRSGGPVHVKGYPPVDLEMICLSGPDSVMSGNTYPYQWTVVNSGEAVTPVSYWNDAIYLSTDSVFHFTDQFVNSVQVNEILEKDSSYVGGYQLKIPNGSQGNYYLFSYADLGNRTNDSDTSNNYSILCDNLGNHIRLNIQLAPSADLQITSLDVPVSVTSGQPFYVYYTIENDGSAATASSSWADRLYLSTDFNVDPSDYILGTKTHLGILAASNSYYDSISVTIPVNYSGNYVLILKTDANNVEYEHNAENNNTDAGATLVTQSPPADLIVTAVSTADSVNTGETVNVQWTLKNIGSNPAYGYMRDQIYLSPDSIWDVTDALIGDVNRLINLIPNASANHSSNVRISGVALGDYYVIVRTDIRNNINEIIDTNNNGFSSPLNVNVPLLPLNVWTTDSLFNGYELAYRIEIPSNLEGESLLIELKGDSVNGSNEMFLKFNGMATGADNDFSFSDPFSGNQEIVVPTLQTGNWYLLVKGNAPAGVQEIRIRPRILDFEIRSVASGKGGNTGKVTVMIKGSKFDSTTIFHLTSPLDTITSLAVYFVNPTLMYATFDLKGSIKGTYSMVAEKTGNEFAKKNDCFVIEDGIPPDLNIHVRKPSGARTNRVVTMVVEYGNRGNTDITDEVLVLNSATGAPVSFTLDGLSAKLKALEIDAEESGGPPGILRAGASGTIIIYTYSSAALGFNIILPDLND